MINIVIALDCEAKPLIDYYALKRQQQHSLPVYSSDNMQLIVAGVGKLNAATATAYLAAITNELAAWLNIGIAGHKEHALGDLYAAHKISDHATQQNWYPALSFKPNIATATVYSFEQPVTDYHDDILHDMEAAGFYQTACRFNSVEFVHCLKVVSDNDDNATHKINKQMVSELVTGQLEAINGFIEKLTGELTHWSEITATPAIYTAVLDRWHFSTYQQHQLRQLLKRWSTLNPEQSLQIEQLALLKSSRDVLQHFQLALDIQ